jgi:nitronate monooxygenase
MTGDFEAMALYAGKGVSRLQSIVSTEERVRNIVTDAEKLMTA